MKIHGKKVYTFLYNLMLILGGIAAGNAQEPPVLDLSAAAPVTCVLGGTVQAQPVRTSYGFVALLDGRTLTGLAQDGTVLWQRATAARAKPYIARGPSDTLCIVTGSSAVQLLNPTGLTVWKANAGFAVTAAPCFGRDGRIFVRGRDAVACIGTNGVRKWSLTLPALRDDVPLIELNDGTLLAFLAETQAGRSIANRISPFGEVLEQVIFLSEVKSAVCTDDGILVTFSSGGTALCAIMDGTGGTTAGRRTLETVWSIASGTDGFTPGCYAFAGNLPQGLSAILGPDSGGTRVSFITTGDGMLQSTQRAGVPFGSLLYAEYTAAGLVLADGSRAACAATDGTIAWQAQFDGRKKWTHVFSSDRGYLLFARSDWTLEAYRVTQRIGSASTSFYERQVGTYRGFLGESARARGLTPAQRDAMRQELLAGDYGVQEADWLRSLDAELQAMVQEFSQKNSRPASGEQPYFAAEAEYTADVLRLCSLTGSASFCGTLANLLAGTQDTQLRLSVIGAMATIGLDADGKMLDALSRLAHDANSTRNVVLMQAVCDATVSICRYMGRPAFFEQANSMLGTLMLPSYDSRIRDYALQTLRTLGTLRI